MTQSALDVQVAGSHYKDLKIQPVEYIHANNIPFIEGSVIKYVSRWRAKGGVKDLEKAKHFLDLLIELENKGTVLAKPTPEPPWYPDVGNPRYGPWVEHDPTYGYPDSLRPDYYIQALQQTERAGREFDPTCLLPGQIAWTGEFGVIAYRVRRDE